MAQQQRENKGKWYGSAALAFPLPLYRINGSESNAKEA
jgi:hypothetical protein